jgi:hypothetical protein
MATCVDGAATGPGALLNLEQLRMRWCRDQVIEVTVYKA